MIPFIEKVFAGDSVIGEINNPLENSYGAYNNTGAGIVGLLTNIIRLAFVIAGIFALFNFIIAGYQYMMAAGDAKKLEAAWARIWQTLVGLIIVVSSFILAVIFGYLFFRDPMFILRPKIYGPGDF